MFHFLLNKKGAGAERHDKRQIDKGQRHFEGPGQDQVKGQRQRKVSLPASSEPKTLSPKRYGIAQFQARLLVFALGIFTEMARALHLPAVG